MRKEGQRKNPKRSITCSRRRSCETWTLQRQRDVEVRDSTSIFWEDICQFEGGVSWRT